MLRSNSSSKSGSVGRSATMVQRKVTNVYSMLTGTSPKGSARRAVANIGGAATVHSRLSTAVTEEYDMWLLPLHEFVGLAALEPHQVLRLKGKLVRWDPSMKHVFFLSHQWTSFDHPDHTCKQLRTMQILFLRFMGGRVADTTLEFESRAYLTDDVHVTSTEWQRIVAEGLVFVWPVPPCGTLVLPVVSRAVPRSRRIDYCCVPQVGKYYNETPDEGTVRAQSDLVRAVNSIPAYIERCTHFFAVCPTIHHKDLPGAVCDYGSWLRRAWCNLELYALLLARYGSLPAIVVKGGTIAPYLISPTSVVARLPGHGELTCCARGHKLRDAASGAERTIPCDRAKIGRVLETMLSKRQKYHLGRGEYELYRVWRAAGVYVLSGLPAYDSALAAAGRGADDFLRVFKYEGHGLGEIGLTPLHCAAMVGNVGVLRELLSRGDESGGSAVNAPLAKSFLPLGFVKGSTPLHAAPVEFSR